MSKAVKFKFYVTRWALTKGIKEVDGCEVVTSSHGNVKYVSKGALFVVLGRDAFDSLPAARSRVCAMAKAKLGSMEKQKAKLLRIINRAEAAVHLAEGFFVGAGQQDHRTPTQRGRETMKDKDFGWALSQLHDGQRVQRAGWNGKGMFLFLVRGWRLPPSLATNLAACELAMCELSPFFAMKTADGKVVPWLASQTDMLATDWSFP